MRRHLYFKNTVVWQKFGETSHINPHMGVISSNTFYDVLFESSNIGIEKINNKQGPCEATSWGKRGETR